MKRFIEGEERSQITLLPECLDDYIAEDNPVRVVDVFVDELQICASWASMVRSRRPPAGRVSPGGPAEDLHLRLSQPHSVEPAPGARSAAQRRADVADRPPGAGLQDHRRLPQGPRRGDPQGVPRVRPAVPPAEACSPTASSPSTAASSRRSTTATRTSPSASCKRGCSSSSRASARYLAELDRADRDADHGSAERVAHLKEKIAKVKEQMRSARRDRASSCRLRRISRSR